MLLAGTPHTCSHNFRSEMLSAQKIISHTFHTRTIDDRDLKIGWNVRCDVPHKVLQSGLKIFNSFLGGIFGKNNHLIFAFPYMELVATRITNTKMDVSIFSYFKFFFYDFFSSFHKTPNNAFIWNSTRKRSHQRLERLSCSMWSSIFTFLGITVTEL